MLRVGGAGGVWEEDREERKEGKIKWGEHQTEKEGKVNKRERLRWKRNEGAKKDGKGKRAEKERLVKVLWMMVMEKEWDIEGKEEREDEDG